MLHGHGDDIYQSGTNIRANFSTNVWYDADADIIRSVIKTQIDKIFHYPEPEAESLVQEIARHHSVSPGQVLAGNGATELFYLIAHAFEAARTLLPIPSFKEYEDACVINKHQLTYIPLDDFRITTDADLMFICNPNNPNGYTWSTSQIENLLSLFPKMNIVVDESFIDFAPGVPSCESLFARYPNLIIVHSMTKNYAVPGLRLGYMLAHEPVIERVKAYKQPWSVNALAIEMGKFLIQNGQYLLPNVEKLMHRKNKLINQLSAIPGFNPLPSGTSFFLVHTRHNVLELKQYLIANHGILIREASNFRGLDQHYFRINTLSDDKNQLLVQALLTYHPEITNQPE